VKAGPHNKPAIKGSVQKQTPAEAKAAILKAKQRPKTTMKVVAGKPDKATTKPFVDIIDGKTGKVVRKDKSTATGREPLTQAHKDAVSAALKAKYAADPGYRKRVSDGLKAKYKFDPTYKKKVITSLKERNAGKPKKETAPKAESKPVIKKVPKKPVEEGTVETDKAKPVQSLEQRHDNLLKLARLKEKSGDKAGAKEMLTNADKLRKEIVEKS
jgi:hypothetical protein